MLKSAPQCFGDDTALTIGFTRGVGSVFALQGGEHLPYAVELGTDSSYSVEPSDGVVLLPDHHEKAPTAVDRRSHHHHSPPPPPPPPPTPPPPPPTASNCSSSSSNAINGSGHVDSRSEGS